MTIASVVHGCWILVADIMLGLVLPVLLLRQLQMNIRAKSSVFVLLGLSLLYVCPFLYRNLDIPPNDGQSNNRDNRPNILPHNPHNRRHAPLQQPHHPLVHYGTRHEHHHHLRDNLEIPPGETRHHHRLGSLRPARRVDEQPETAQPERF